MRSVRLVQLGHPLQDVEATVPKIGPADVLVRVAACGICHSDAHYRAGTSPIAELPVTPGHEVAGTV
ncbi:MAG: alcohol dehydrogenase catalytic domain-containing protein, partial [Chthoniobacterales bacterium]|nr:alcohol dehydrogenase catalytic domain-containing protein [Chthoniobacterales bacterium]